ncbi:1-acyl-sn-glycerol-3-phosphate acyltransferase epsilon-like isoform X1 [Amphibalanus amphitrite]|nr:1-acyl-sn-glycerol-3-phosphate acyltransferase epsilon-like isoform X1 [Amphibalanus amphitrite]XP_043242478.1 1-acyl-sn-glycerol-3-phosphate acyltransferase epsilon-like isoform X1 [Amphibalanus amphitrite]XP_043242479.1 1-acyl-sn-glycerol-3-phosphate acyltransferase epsilon-like isoform X1 [Amphibalanus amphitrite]XP_043242480.1 1-acyl-sn-glycerol-3-phosphate acyltransferase epsilon-like isoform X1 [Amphibalanus amphitrite]XP_043242481.1 1-acyl-sn-glycerol-3-phosphate acyltransferase epsil
MFLTKLPGFGIIRYAISTSIMVGAAPEYYAVWLGWRLFSIPLPAWLYQKVDDMLYSTYQRLVLLFFEHGTGLKIYFYGDADEIFKKKENVLYISNHQSTVDWVACNMVAVRQGSLGHLRFVMKDGLQWLPLYGHYFYQHGCIYVRRGQFRQDKMMRGLEYLQQERVQSWVAVFPEGTRYDPSKPEVIRRSEQTALSSGFQPLKHHLTPKTKGSWLTLDRLRGSLEAVYDVTVVYEGSYRHRERRRARTVALIDFLRGFCPAMHIHVRRIPISEVPTDEQEFQRWMYQLYEQKDRFVAPFYSPSDDSGAELAARLGGRPHPLPLTATVPSLMAFAALAVPLLGSELGRRLYAGTLLYGTLAGYLWLGIRAVC